MRHSLLKYKSINFNNIDTIDDDNDDDHDMNLNSHDDFANDDIESSASDHSILTSDKLTSATTNRDYDRRIKTTNNKYINKKKVISNNNKNKNKNNLNWLSSLCLQYDDYCINLYLFLYLLLLIIIIILLIIIYTSNQYDYHQLYHDLFIYQQHSSLSNYSSSSSSNSSNHCGDNRTATGIDNYHIISGDKNDSFYILVGKQQQQHLQQQQVSSSRSLYCYLSSSLLNQEGTGVSIPILMIEQLTTGLGKYNNSITYMTLLSSLSSSSLSSLYLHHHHPSSSSSSCLLVFS